MSLNQKYNFLVAFQRQLQDAVANGEAIAYDIAEGLHDCLGLVPDDTEDGDEDDTPPDGDAASRPLESSSDDIPDERRRPRVDSRVVVSRARTELPGIARGRGKE